MKYLKSLFVAITALLVGIVMAGPASAGGSPHFIKNLTTASTNGTVLTVNFKEAGLQSGATETVTIAATYAVTYECVNGGSHNPAASNKQTFSSNASASGKFTADKNGNLIGSLSLDAPSAADLGFTCPPGQTVTLYSVVWSGVSITDNTSGAYLDLKGTFSYVNPDAPKPR